MKVFNTIMKILAALAAVAGAIYLIATYGDKIVAWAKNLLNCSCCCGDECCCCDDECCCDEEDCCCEGECECCCEDAPAEEAPVEEAPAEEAATEADFVE